MVRLALCRHGAVDESGSSLGLTTRSLLFSRWGDSKDLVWSCAWWDENSCGESYPARPPKGG